MSTTYTASLSTNTISLRQPTQRSDFKIAIVCALQIEYDAVCLLVDEFWDADFGRAEGDSNFYTTGSMSNHHVVIILLASMGKTSAASTVANMRMSFTAVQILLLVGICGGIPSGPRGEILLGDVILGDEVKIYDYGKQYTDGFRRTESFGYSTSNFNRSVRGLLSFLETDRGTRLLEDRTSHHLQCLQESSKSTKIKYAYPGAEEDQLFAPDYRHKHHQRAPCICRGCLTDSDPICDEAIKASCLETDCDTSCIIPRQRITEKQNLGAQKAAETQRPVVHFGRLASADTVLKSAKDRDALSQELQVIGFEMEAAGFHNELPYIIIKSVCDYADSHKSKAWQPFAAAAAASACKSLLERYPQSHSTPTKSSRDHESGREVRTHSAICVIPLLKNERFVGRQDALTELKEMLFEKRSFNRAALVGLGGLGKTQIALQLAYLMKDVLRDEDGRECSVLWIPVVSVATFEQACADIARQLPRPKGAEEDAKQMIKDHFSAKTAGRWLLVLDNADDHELIFGNGSTPGGLLQHLPRSDLGCILVTTRDRRVAVGFADNNVVTLSEMSMGEADAFFRKSLIRRQLVGADEAIRSLLEFLERIPLAIAQAAAYININQVTVGEFLGLLQGVPRDQISVLSRHFEDSTRYQGSQNAIAMTWLASFDKISQTDATAAKLLAFISYIEPKGIPRSLLPEGESQEEFLHAVGTLLGYGFLNLHQENLYDMHRLVHIAATVWSRKESTDAMTLDFAMKHILLIFPRDRFKNRGKLRLYLPHALKISQDNLSFENQHSQDLAHYVGRALKNERRFDESILVLERLVASMHMAESADPVRLYFQRSLASVYQHDRQYKKVISLLEPVVAIREKYYGEEHEDTFSVKRILARAYRGDGQIEKARSIVEHIVAVRKTTVGQNHRKTVAAQFDLAVLYQKDGRTEQAISILEDVVTLRKKTLDPRHPDVLAAQNQLARRYYDNGQTEKALPLMEGVVRIWRETLREGDRLRLDAEETLAQMYQDLPEESGKFEQGEAHSIVDEGI